MKKILILCAALGPLLCLASFDSIENFPYCAEELLAANELVEQKLSRAAERVSRGEKAIYAVSPLLPSEEELLFRIVRSWEASLANLEVSLPELTGSAYSEAIQQKYLLEKRIASYKDVLVRSVTRVARTWVRSYLRNPLLDEVDVEGEMLLGLYDAYQRFDLAQGTRLSTYAAHRVRNRMSNLWNYHTRPQRDVHRTQNFALDARGRFATPGNAAVVADPSSELRRRERLEKVKTEVRSAITTLPEKTQELLILRFGLNGEKPKKLDELAEMYGISREGARRRVLRATHRLSNLPALRKLSEE